MKGLLAVLVALALVLSLVPATLAAGVATVARFDTGMGEYPDGLAIGPGGQLYVGMRPTGEIHRVSATGENIPFAQLPSGPLNALAVDPDGDWLYATLATGNPSTHGIWRVNLATQAAERYAALPVEAYPHGLAFREDDLFVSDSAQGRIFRIAPSRQVTTWSADVRLRGDMVQGDPPIGANGLAFTHAQPTTATVTGEYLYVANSDYGRILRIPVLLPAPPAAIRFEATGTAGPTAGPVEVFYEQSVLLRGAHGISFDAGPNGGTLFVAVKRQNRLVAITPAPQPQAQVVLEGAGLHHPTSVVHAAGVLYLTNSTETDDPDIDLPGAPNWAVVRITDLPLPMRR